MPAVTGPMQVTLPLLAAAVETGYWRGAAQLALVPLFAPSQLHVKLDAPLVTALAVPTLHKFALGAARTATPLAVPQAPLIGLATNDAVTVQSAATAPVVYAFTPALVAVPPHPEMVAVWKPALGVAVHVVVPPAVTGLVQLRVPFAPALAVTVY